MRAIFRFCIFPVIVLGSLLITAERLLFDKKPDVLTNPEFLDYKNAEDSLMFITSDTLSANVAVHDLVITDYNDSLIKHDCSLQNAGFQHDSGNEYKSEELAVHDFVGPDDLGLLNRKTKNKNKQEYGISQKAYSGTDTSRQLYAKEKIDTALTAAGKVSVVLACSTAKLTSKQIAPLSEEIFDNMQNTVKNKVKPSLTFSLHPNPATDKLIVETRDWDNMQSIQIFTLNGKSVYKTELPRNEIDVGSFASGLYVLIITNKDGSQNSQKVVIHRE